VSTDIDESVLDALRAQRKVGHAQPSMFMARSLKR
jgi:hypothetical protein